MRGSAQQWLMNSEMKQFSEGKEGGYSDASDDDDMATAYPTLQTENWQCSM